MAKLFVYGTLKQGRSHYTGGKEFSPDTIKGKMYNVGAFPAVVLGGESVVHGEVIEVDDSELAQMDRYEGYQEGDDNSLYKRISITTLSGEECFVYEFNKSTIGMPVIDSGVWR